MALFDEERGQIDVPPQRLRWARRLITVLIAASTTSSVRQADL